MSFSANSSPSIGIFGKDKYKKLSAKLCRCDRNRIDLLQKYATHAHQIIDGGRSWVLHHAEGWHTSG